MRERVEYKHISIDIDGLFMVYELDKVKSERVKEWAAAIHNELLCKKDLHTLGTNYESIGQFSDYSMIAPKI